MSTVGPPFQLLEMNIISAKDLACVSKSVRAYAVAWLHSDRKLATQIDQAGHTNPTWNEKFVFRVDEEFLNSESSAIMIEIYASSWIKDILIGTVGVLVSNLLPPSSRSRNHKPKLRFVALQIRKPSGRPQGILNIGVTLLDSTMRSMPLYSELSSSAVGYSDLMNKKKPKNDEINHKNCSPMDPKLLTLQRCQSDKCDSSINEYNYNYYGTEKHGNRNGYAVDGEDSEVSAPIPRKVGNEESLCSDVGPSPSVVAAAIAKGLYPLPAPPRTTESSIVDGWSENSGTEGMNTKIERWRAEITPAYEDYEETKKKFEKSSKRIGKTSRRHRQRNGLFSCFGTVFGCEFSITCRGGNQKKRHGGKGNLMSSASELTFDDSFV